MAITNNDIAAIFNRVADLLELSGGNEFRVRAYRGAAMSVASFSQSLADIIISGQEIPKLAGIGKDLEGKIGEIVKTGKLAQLKELESQVPTELIELTHLPGLGAKRVRLIYDKLGVKTIDALEKAARSEKIRAIRGLGEKTEKNILAEIEKRKGLQQNVRLIDAIKAAAPLVEYLKAVNGVTQVTVAGSYRRRKETVRDVDILVTCSKAKTVMDAFAAYPLVKQILAKGLKKTTVVLASGLQVDVRAVSESSYGAALVYFTGSKEHNVAIRKIGVRKKIKLNEYGVFRGKRRIAGKTEEDVYATVDLPWIEPELREDRGEIDAATSGNLPSIIELSDIQGDLHAHTTATDGRSTLEEMIEAAISRGYKYLAITEHTQHVTVAKGLEPKAMRKRLAEIEKAGQKYKEITILKGAEIDILGDGSLDLPEEILEELDIRVCAVHYKFNLTKEEQTSRILKAMENPWCQILAHATGRQINIRSGYEVDLPAIFRAAAQHGVALECNAQPARLDLNDLNLRAAKEAGAKFVISTDSHHTSELEFMQYGVWQARRGWLEKRDVLNSQSLKVLLSSLRKAPQAALSHK
ncbi:MAG: DNA polymerase III [Planctomycetes bacterium GWF2_50_10]|nr:MAG: DNA polymerase III [Planctomycetes bacterium GWF2_50_10]